MMRIDHPCNDVSSDKRLLQLAKTVKFDTITNEKKTNQQGNENGKTKLIQPLAKLPEPHNTTRGSAGEHFKETHEERITRAV